MKTLTIIFIVLLVGCGSFECTEPDFTIAGLDICTENVVDYSEVEETVRVLEEEIRVIYPGVTGLAEMFAAQGVSVFFIDEDLALGCRKISGGVYRCKHNISGAAGADGHKLFIRWRACLAWTALAHELLHSVEYFYLDGANNHTTPYFFIQDAEAQGMVYQATIEYKTGRRLNDTFPNCQE